MQKNLAEKNGQWKGGTSNDYYRRLAKENFNQECSICKAIEKLGVHHIDGNHKNNQLINLIILCNKCHCIEHKKMRGWSWSKEYSECRMCKRTSLKHAGKGYCKTCYMKVFRPNHVKEWYQKNKERHHKLSRKNYLKRRDIVTIL